MTSVARQPNDADIVRRSGTGAGLSRTGVPGGTPARMRRFPVRAGFPLVPQCTTRLPSACAQVARAGAPLLRYQFAHAGSAARKRSRFGTAGRRGPIQLVRPSWTAVPAIRFIKPVSTKYG